ERSPAKLADAGSDAAWPDADVGLIVGRQDHFDTWPEYLAAPAVERQAVERRERIRRDIRLEPLYRITVVVVMRRLDHNQMKELGPVRWHSLLSELLCAPHVNRT